MRESQCSCILKMLQFTAAHTQNCIRLTCTYVHNACTHDIHYDIMRSLCLCLLVSFAFEKNSSLWCGLLLAVTKKVEVVEFIRIKYIKQKERIVSKKCSINGEKRKYIQFAIPILQFNFVIFIINIIAATCFCTCKLVLDGIYFPNQWI